MNPYGYTKLYHSIFGSSVWSETPATRCVFLTLLGNVDYQTGKVLLSFPGLVRLANVTHEECKEAMRILEAPDIHSKSQEWGGRRIERIDGGWLILNYLKYRDMQTPAQSASAERQRRFRDKRAAEHAWLKEHPGQPLPDPFPGELVERYVTLRNARERTNKDVDVNPDVDIDQNEEEAARQSPIAKLAAFLDRHRFGQWREIVEGYIRGSKKPINVMAHLELCLTGEMGYKRQPPEAVGFALNQYASSGHEGFIAVLFDGYMRRVPRQLDRNVSATERDQEDVRLAQERREKEERAADERDQALLIDFEQANPEKFAEFRATAERSVPKNAASKDPSFRDLMVRTELIRLVRKAA